MGLVKNLFGSGFVLVEEIGIVGAVEVAVAPMGR
jgi:hypothetical protein